MTLARTLPKGANTPLPTEVLRIAVSWEPARAIDLCAVLVTDDERVRTDTDFVFYNQPRHPSGAVSLGPAERGSAALTVALPRIEPAIDRIVIAASLDTGTFADLAEITVDVTGPGQRAVARFRPDDVEPVTALVFGEVYRRSGGWRFRAVGQGWDSGLAGLARGFGIRVRDDEPAEPRRPARRPATPRTDGASAGDVDHRGPRPGPNPVARRTERGPGTPPGPRSDRGLRPEHDSGPPRGPGPARSPRPESGRGARRAGGAVGRAPDDMFAAPTLVDLPAQAPRADSPTETLTEPVTEAGSGSDTWPRPGSDAGSRADQGDRADAGGRRSLDGVGPRFRADWYPDPVEPGRMRWWDGESWQGPSEPILAETEATCGRCGVAKGWRLFGGPQACEPCAEAVRAFLWDWRARVAESLMREDPTGAALEPLWTELRYQRIPEPTGWEIVTAVGHAHLERLAAFAVADGTVEPAEVDVIEAAAERLRVAGPPVDALRARLARGLELTRISAGELPRLPAGSLHLELDEFVHLDTDATLLRELAGGPRHSPGRLIASNRKLRFLGDSGSGTELTLSKIVEIEVGPGRVDISATTTRGGGAYLVDDPQYVAAVLAGILRVARRQVMAPGTRDSRAIPQSVKAEVWQRDGGACVECRGTEYLEFDHVIPFSRGGASSVNNLQLLCRRCNRSKGARI